MIEIKLWKPCLDCEHADVDVSEEYEMVPGYVGQARKVARVACSHAPVCALIDGAKPLIGGDAS